MKQNKILFLSLTISVIGIILMIYYASISSFNDWHWKINPELASQYGSFISGITGPIFTLVGFLLIYETIRRQRIDFDKQQFETKFFELVRYHRENVEQMTFKNSYSKTGNITTGRQVIVELKKQCHDIVEDIMLLIPKHNNQTDKEYIENILKISILIFYYGVSKRTKDTVLRILDNYIPTDKERIINELRKKKTKYNDSIVFYGGHQSKLGNYFRHLFHTVRFVDESTCLNDSEKKSFIKILKAQLSNYEQALLFYNSMCPLGNKWREVGYILKYKMINNLPPNFLGSVDFSQFYEMHYEYENY